jgi:hypothetical protein
MRRFIVGTGRCGSTLLSRMLRMNPHVLDISEFYSGLDWNRRFQRGVMSGREFWNLISTPHPFISMVLERGYRPPEVAGAAPHSAGETMLQIPGGYSRREGVFEFIKEADGTITHRYFNPSETGR